MLEIVVKTAIFDKISFIFIFSYSIFYLIVKILFNNSDALTKVL